jgi:hypothetical protein
MAIFVATDPGPPGRPVWTEAIGHERVGHGAACLPHALAERERWLSESRMGATHISIQQNSKQIPDDVGHTPCADPFLVVN